ncbi:hypothetical protein B0H10DRAFT_1044660 [Mycena sp. CBHHK59/15]|nr:hypothetical protein B0H10DRAFT_1044660 [Mycena sp. CBHHK59/15]
MDLISYYAQHGPQTPASEGASKETTSKTIATSVEIEHKEALDDSDVEEDDSQEVLREEVLALMHSLRFPGAELRARVIPFNNANPTLGCTTCTAQNIDCKIDHGARLRCQRCSSKRTICSRTEVFNRWIIRHKFRVSWERAAEILEDGWALVRLGKQGAEGADTKTKAKARARPPAFSPKTPVTGAVRISSRTPVPRVRKAPAVLVAPDDTPSPRVRSRPGKRRAPAGPSRVDRKRRKVKAEPESEAEPKFEDAEPEPEPAAEAESEEETEARSEPERKPTSREKKRASGREKQRGALAQKQNRATRLAVPSRAELSARLAATEARLDALEVRLQAQTTPEPRPTLSNATRERMTFELNLAIGEVVGNAQAAVERLRALRGSLAREDIDADGEEDADDHEGFSLGGCWGPSDGLLLDGAQASVGAASDGGSALNAVTATDDVSSA